MKTINIIGENYPGQWKRTRTACRAIVLDGSRILMSYETKTDLWMTPGGGLEPDETEQVCCIREVAEETGVIVDPVVCYLEINEFYGDWKWVNRYFICSATGTTEPHLTDREKTVGMEPRWIDVDEVKSIFAQHQSYAATDEDRRGMYLREYTALCELFEAARMWEAERTS